MRPRLLLSLVSLTLPASSLAADKDAVGTAFFEQKIRPVLVEKCYSCHSATAEKLKGNLFLDTREGAIKGGDLGPSVVPGDPDRSLLIKAIRYADDDLKMPPKKPKLADADIAKLERWVAMGAPDPRVAKVANADATWWSLKPIVRPAVPEAKFSVLSAQFQRPVVFRLNTEH